MCCHCSRGDVTSVVIRLLCACLRLRLRSVNILDSSGGSANTSAVDESTGAPLSPMSKLSPAPSAGSNTPISDVSDSGSFAGAGDSGRPPLSPCPYEFDDESDSSSCDVSSSSSSSSWSGSPAPLLSPLQEAEEQNSENNVANVHSTGARRRKRSWDRLRVPILFRSKSASDAAGSPNPAGTTAARKAPAKRLQSSHV